MMLFMALLYTLCEGGKEFLQVGVLRPHALSGKRGSAREGKRIMPKLCQSTVFRLYTKEIKKQFRVDFFVMFGVCIVCRDVA